MEKKPVLQKKTQFFGIQPVDNHHQQAVTGGPPAVSPARSGFLDFGSDPVFWHLRKGWILYKMSRFLQNIYSKFFIMTLGQS